MAKYSIEYSTLKGIGNAVREKEGTSADIPVPELETRIRAITTGVDTSADTVTADSLLEGYTAHDAAGNAVEGKAEDATALEEDIVAQDAIIAQMAVAVEAAAEAVESAGEEITIQNEIITQMTSAVEAAAEAVAGVNEEISAQDDLIAQIVTAATSAAEAVAGVDEELTAQDDLIAQIIRALQSKGG